MRRGGLIGEYYLMSGAPLSTLCENACELYLKFTAICIIEHTDYIGQKRIRFRLKRKSLQTDRYSSYNMLNPVLYRTYCYDGSGSHYSLCSRVQLGVYDGNEVHVQSISCYNMHFKIFSHLLQGST